MMKTKGAKMCMVATGLPKGAAGMDAAKAMGKKAKADVYGPKDVAKARKKKMK